MKKVLILSLLLTLGRLVTAQENKSYLDLVKAETQLNSLFETLYNEEIFGTHLNLFHTLDSLFMEALKLPGSFSYTWPKLTKIGKLKSTDDKLKVFSWLYMASRNEYYYSAFFQIQSTDGEVETIRLNPSDNENYSSEDFPQDTENWHGKIYYDLVTTEYKRKTYYTLIGADFNNTSSSIKTIEVVTIQRGSPLFRGDQFLIGGTVKDRIVLEYSADLAASVRFNKELNMIVYDHLAPLHPLYHGNFQFYGPDGSYDGLSFREGIWVLEEDVDARNL